jgi:hypothetical protein
VRVEPLPKCLERLQPVAERGADPHQVFTCPGAQAPRASAWRGGHTGALA